MEYMCNFLHYYIYSVLILGHVVILSFLNSFLRSLCDGEFKETYWVFVMVVMWMMVVAFPPLPELHFPSTLTLLGWTALLSSLNRPC